jgi:hypothetical protein
MADEPLAALPPEDDRWWGNPWAAFLAGVLGLLAGGILGYAIGDSSNTVTTTGRGTRAAITQTVTRTNTVTQPKVVERSNTVTATTQAPAPAGPAGEERRAEDESRLRRAERENEELKRQLEEN